MYDWNKEYITFSGKPINGQKPSLVKEHQKYELK
jgi:hypothetical protein